MNIVWLSDERAADPAIVGAKAASLARAKAAGLPVLDGFVVAVAAGVPVLAAGAEVLRSRNSGFARAAITGSAIDPVLAKELSVATESLGRRLVVRSSSLVEGQGVWAGAFASYAELAPHEVAQGVAGCWASVFTPDALRRGEALGIGPADVGMAALVQPEIQPELGGVATVGGSGTVTIAVVEGPPAAIVSGWERGHLLVVAADEIAPADTALALGEERVRAVAELARAAAAMGSPHVEWAEENGHLWLLQAQPTAPPRPADGLPASGPELPNDPRLGDLARLLARFPGPVGEQLVLSWAVGHGRLPDPTPAAQGLDAPAMLKRCQALSTGLAADRWPGVVEPGRVLRELDGGDPEVALAALSDPPPLDEPAAAELLGLLEALAIALQAAGSIPGPGWLTLLRPHELAELAAGGRLDPGRRIGLGPREPLLHRIAIAQGASRQGDPAAPGWGAGPIRLIRDASGAERFAPREIVATVNPINNLAPLLWDAAALIAVDGSPGAHLFEVASWVGVPAVCNVDLEAAAGMSLDDLQGRPGLVGAVDGDRGTVFVIGGPA